MGSTILTVIVLVVMWVVVLVPMFTRRNEESDETMAGRFGGAVRILARRSRPAPHVSRADRTEDEADAVDEDTAEELSDVDIEDEEVPELIERPMPSARAQMLARRRRTLGTIIMLAVMTALLAIGWRPRIWVIQIGLDVLLVGYLWWLRQEVHRERARRERRAQRGEPIARTAARPNSRRPAPVSTRRPVASPVAEPEEPVVEETAVDDGRWEPRPVPTPTYVNAAIVQRRRVVVEEDPVHEAVALDDQDPGLSDEFDDYPTLEITPQRAVNG
jgi:hypothetical protein